MRPSSFRADADGTTASSFIILAHHSLSDKIWCSQILYNISNKQQFFETARHSLVGNWRCFERGSEYTSEAVGQK